jgi:hypothetical protein
MKNTDGAECFWDADKEAESIVQGHKGYPHTLQRILSLLSEMQL